MRTRGGWALVLISVGALYMIVAVGAPAHAAAVLNFSWYLLPLVLIGVFLSPACSGPIPARRRSAPGSRWDGQSRRPVSRG
jgi:hypothetical protein